MEKENLINELRNEVERLQRLAIISGDKEIEKIADELREIKDSYLD